MTTESHLDGSSGTSPDLASGDGSGDGKPKHVSFDTYSKTVTAERNAKQKLQETQEKLLVFENQARAIEEQKLLSEKRHVELIEQLKREKQELESKTNNLQQEQIDFRKLNATLALLQEKGIQLESKYLGLLPLDRIQIGDEGRIDLGSVASVVQEFQKEHPRLTASNANFLPGNKSGGSAASMSVEEWKKLPYAEKQEALKQKKVKHDFKF